MPNGFGKMESPGTLAQVVSVVQGGGEDKREMAGQEIETMRLGKFLEEL